jgi:hypothetical protein
LYGLDTDNDDFPDQFVNAATINQKENTAGESQGSVWRRVVAVHVALMMQADVELVDRTSIEAIDLFGQVYSKENAAGDSGVHLLLSDFSVGQKKCLSRVFQRLVFLRNRATLNNHGGLIDRRESQ